MQIKTPAVRSDQNPYQILLVANNYPLFLVIQVFISKGMDLGSVHPSIKLARS